MEREAGACVTRSLALCAAPPRCAARLPRCPWPPHPHPAPAPHWAATRHLWAACSNTPPTRCRRCAAGKSLTDVLTRCPADLRPGVQALSFHTLRWLGSATELRALLAPKTPPPAVDALLVTALALLWPGQDGQDTPPYAEHTLVDQAVSAARVRTPAAAGFINAVLRRFLREREALVPAAQRSALGAYNHPLWWVERVKRDWPQHWQALLTGANRRPPMTLRVNARRGTRRGLCARPGRAGPRRDAARQPGGPDPGRGQTVVLAQPSPVHQLPGFAEGEVSVQDAAAQRAAALLLQGADLPPRARVLDACAAPGGKTAHLLELADLDLLALDSDPLRLARVQDNLNRLQLKAELKAGDGRFPKAWWDGRPFDAILLDAPCTASGIVRRHPDVRWLRRQDDIQALARIQAELLDALWPLLAPGWPPALRHLFHLPGRGPAADRRIFATPAPGDSPAGTPVSGASVATARQCFRRVLPAGPSLLQDGFFYALLRKTHAPRS